ncbi:MAG TPA: serine hydrolase domain-containing protein [Cellvibrionaceae bacterium]
MTTVEGFWPEQWSPLVAQFKDNFSNLGEEGAALAVVKKGECIASLWAGHRDRQRSLPWQESTPVNIFSAGKPLVATAVLHLAQTGSLDLQRPINDYWPEFGTRGKELITTEQVLSHTSGLSAFHPTVKEHVIFEPALVRSLLAVETPWWEPGTQQGYSPFLYGWILAELVRRVSGAESFNDYFQAEIAQPLNLNVYFGVPETEQWQLAEVAPLKRQLAHTAHSSPGASSVELGKLMKQDPRGVTNRAFSNPPSLMGSTNSAAWRSAEIPAAAGHASARALAGFYGALLTERSPLQADTLRSAVREHSAAVDAVLAVELRFGHGFMLSRPQADCHFGTQAGFGHPGAGGSVGFADPETGIGFAYVTARMGQSVLIDRRAQALIQALYACL